MYKCFFAGMTSCLPAKDRKITGPPEWDVVTYEPFMCTRMSW